MTPAQAASNPFAMLMEPEAVLAAVARSELLARLHSRRIRRTRRRRGRSGGLID
jgi:hypothetical protein